MIQKERISKRFYKMSVNLPAFPSIRLLRSSLDKINRNFINTQLYIRKKTPLKIPAYTLFQKTL